MKLKLRIRRVCRCLLLLTQSMRFCLMLNFLRYEFPPSTDPPCQHRETNVHPVQIFIYFISFLCQYRYLQNDAVLSPPSPVCLCLSLSLFLLGVLYLLLSLVQFQFISQFAVGLRVLYLLDICAYICIYQMTLLNELLLPTRQLLYAFIC